MRLVTEWVNTGVNSTHRVELFDRDDLVLLLLVVKRGLNTLEPAPKAAQKLHDDLVRALQ